MIAQEDRMSWYTDWFLADEVEAEAIAAIGDEDGESSFEDWPHLSMKSVGEMELISLRAILCGKPGGTEDYHGDALYQQYDEEGGVAVTAVLPEFLAELVSLTAKPMKDVALLWQQCEAMAEWESATVVEVLREMVAFARRAEKEGKAVLELSTW